MMSKTANEGASTAFLALAVATSFAIGGVGYFSGSAPEWVILKSSIGLLVVGLMGWIVSPFIMLRNRNDTQSTKGSAVDVTLSETVPAKAQSGDALARESLILSNEDSSATTNAAMR